MSVTDGTSVPDDKETHRHKKSLEQLPQPANYKVGYRKPPEHTRFKKGQSGNPGGRPKGSKSIHKLLDDVLSSTVHITEAGEVKTIQQREALFKALVAKAIRGDMRASSLVINIEQERHRKEEAEMAAKAANGLANMSDEELNREIDRLDRQMGYVRVPVETIETSQQDD